jgi:diguanylate cyclase (GGDEF)-like protein
MSVTNAAAMRDGTSLFVRIRQFMSVPTDNPDLMRAQVLALSRLIPLLYFILVANAWVLASTFFGKAPDELNILVAAALSMICALRLVQWWRKRGVALTDERAAHELRRTNKIAVALGIAFSAWGIALFPYGDAYAQAHVGTFLMMAMLCSMLCLIHLRSAALIVALTVCIPFAIFFGATGIPTFRATAVNALLVTVAVVIVIMIQYRDFTRMVAAHKRTELLSNENLRLANLDSLTDLPNRRAFFSHLEEACALAEARGTRVALGIIDLDGFKPVNDLYGHATGDRLLAEVASRLSGACKTKDLFMARLGGDEFAYVVANAPDDAALLAQGEEIVSMLRVPFFLTDVTAQISGSLGVAVYPETAPSPEQLFERADYALYYGKSTRRGTVTLFTSDHQAQINADARIEQALKGADFERELMVVFQPIVDIRTQDVLGFEALARWNSPVLGQVSPARFIPVAERAGIINTLTRPLLRKALSAASKWPAHIRLSFNLSAHDLNSAEGTLGIVAIIEASRFGAGRLDLEITETAFAHDFAQVQRSIETLRRLGCGISLDDFGTGYSSLARLHALPLTKIKIDRRFVTDLHLSANSLKIVKSLLALSRDMGLDCVIEGVETEQELAALRQLGGHMVQGYLYSPPLPAERVAQFLSEHAPDGRGNDASGQSYRFERRAASA